GPPRCLFRLTLSDVVSREPRPTLSPHPKLPLSPLKNSHVCATLAREVRSAMQAAAQHECLRRRFPKHAPNLQPFLANSNRYNKLLELPVTYTKQMTASISNRRYKMALFAQRVFVQSSRNAQACVAVQPHSDSNVKKTR